MKVTRKYIEKNRSSYSIEIKKHAGKTSCIIFGVMLIFAYSRENVELHTHAGKIIIKGYEMDLCVFRDGGVEIDGRLESVSLA